ncbi:hypothetical protein Goshw_002412 [Gossypium schwendimanii]|uniref:Trafficking protein particle complex subunit n=1 Tax=Gossypium schwendimanii TaxID=34291 RepID=A0A7J9MQR1_GOSSC|nr:hypothetical protein [Gossypium schwendimanii]
MIGTGKIKQYANVLDKPLGKGKQEVSLSAFAFLFSELVQYNQTQVDNISELETRLEDAGYAVGARVLELLCYREIEERPDCWVFYLLCTALCGRCYLERWLTHLRRALNMKMST